MDNTSNIEAQSLTGQASTTLRRNYSNRKRQRVATIGLALILTLVVTSVLVWLIIFQPNELGCVTLKEPICQEPQNSFFNETLFKPVFMDNERQNFVFRSRFPLVNKYQIDTTQVNLNIQKLTGLESFNPHEYQMHYFIIANVSSNNQEMCDVAGMFCYEATHHTNKTLPSAKFNLTNILGDETNPYENDQDPKVENLTWQSDRLDLKVKDIEDIVSNCDNNIIIICGKDGINETGELAASFKLFYTKNFTEAVEENIELGSREKPFLNSLMWYCLYLKSSDPNINCKDVYTMEQFSKIDFQD